MNVNNKYLELALEISSCSEVSKALDSRDHPCNKVVDWQAKQWNEGKFKLYGSKMHRPEAWTGDLSSAPIIFLSSNPSFDKGEKFPSWDSEKWSDEEISDFGANRFSFDPSRSFGATESREIEGKDRTIGLDGQLSKRVAHWHWVRRFAGFVLGKGIDETSAINDYVMTELVHCKSPHEQGVVEALAKCRAMWLTKIFSLSPARLIFITGVKAGTDFATLYESEIPSDWGSWAKSKTGKGKGNWPRTADELSALAKNGLWNLEGQKKNSIEIEIAGLKRLVVYVARPGGGGGLYAPWNYPNLIHPELIDYWREKAGIQSKNNER